MAMTEENQKFLCSILSYPQKKKKKKTCFLFLTPSPSFSFLTLSDFTQEKWWQVQPFDMLASEFSYRKDKVCYASIQKYNRCLATCTSTVSVCCKRKKIKNIFFFFFWYRDHPQNRMLPKSPANKAATAPWKESPLPWPGIHTIWH